MKTLELEASSMPSIRIVKAALITPTNQILLLTRARDARFDECKLGDFDLPGGRQDQGESDLETILREIKEETGINVGPEDTTIVKTSREDRADCIVERTFCICRLLETTNVELSGEHSGFVWMNIGEAVREIKQPVWCQGIESMIGGRALGSTPTLL